MKEWIIRVNWGFIRAVRDISVYAETEEEAFEYAAEEASSYFDFEVVDVIDDNDEED